MRDKSRTYDPTPPTTNQGLTRGFQTESDVPRRPPDNEKAAGQDGARRDGSQDTEKGNPSSHDGAHPVNDGLPLIDKLGKRHGTAILRAWSATALRALNVRWYETGATAYKGGEGGHG